MLARNEQGNARGCGVAYLYFRQDFPHFLCLKNQPAWFLSSARAEVVPGGGGFAFCPYAKLGELTAA